MSTVSLCISAIVACELLYGLARRPDAIRQHVAVTELTRFHATGAP
jgi:hypothetical protein